MSDDEVIKWSFFLLGQEELYYRYRDLKKAQKRRWVGELAYDLIIHLGRGGKYFFVLNRQIYTRPQGEIHSVKDGFIYSLNGISSSDSLLMLWTIIGSGVFDEDIAAIKENR